MFRGEIKTQSTTSCLIRFLLSTSHTDTDKQHKLHSNMCEVTSAWHLHHIIFNTVLIFYIICLKNYESQFHFSLEYEHTNMQTYLRLRVCVQEILSLQTEFEFLAWLFNNWLLSSIAKDFTLSRIGSFWHLWLCPNFSPYSLYWSWTI